MIILYAVCLFFFCVCASVGLFPFFHSLFHFIHNNMFAKFISCSVRKIVSDASRRFRGIGGTGGIGGSRSTVSTHSTDSTESTWPSIGA